MTLFWYPQGPMMKYIDGVLHIEDLNPDAHLTWRLSRWEMFKIGFKFILASRK
jgi:hypothetical protein